MHTFGSHYPGLVPGDGDYEFRCLAMWTAGTKLRGLLLLPSMGIRILATHERRRGCRPPSCCAPD